MNYINIYELSIEAKIKYIETEIQNDTKLRNTIKGIVIGQFTIEEYEIYIQNATNLSKRIMSLGKTRLKDQIQLFEIKNLT